MRQVIKKIISEEDDDIIEWRVHGPEFLNPEHLPCCQVTSMELLPPPPPLNKFPWKEIWPTFQNAAELIAVKIRKLAMLIHLILLRDKGASHYDWQEDAVLC